MRMKLPKLKVLTSDKQKNIFQGEVKVEILRQKIFPWKKNCWQIHLILDWLIDWPCKDIFLLFLKIKLKRMGILSTLSPNFYFFLGGVDERGVNLLNPLKPPLALIMLWFMEMFCDLYILCVGQQSRHRSCLKTILIPKNGLYQW